MSRQAGAAVVLWITLNVLSTLAAGAAEQRLADSQYVRHRVEGGAVLIETTGAAKLKISFVSPQMARVQIAAVGEFSANASPAVAGTPPVESSTVVEDGADALVVRKTGLSLRINKRRLRVDAFDGENQRALSLESPEDGTVWDTATGAIRHSRVLADAEHIYGLGQDNANRGTLDRRGTVCDLWTGQQIRSGNVTAEFPVPFYLSTGEAGRGYGCFVDNVWRLKFDLGKTRKDRLVWSAPGGPLDYYLINGPSFKTIIDQYTQLTGRPSMLPLWAFGFWQSKCFYQNFEDMAKTAERLRADGFPLDVMVIDSNWPKVRVDFQWDQPWLKSGRKPEDWIGDFHAKGIHVILSTAGPMIRPDAENYADGWQKGLFATDGHGQPLTCGYYDGRLMDFTHPEMNGWLWPQLAAMTQQGIDGWWLDLIEPEGEPPQAVYYAGKSADIHNTYPLRSFRSYFDYERNAAPEGRPVILGRAATAGAQRYSGIVWSGDTHPDWPTFLAHIPEAQNAGVSGLPWWTNDSGGFLDGFLHNDRYGAHARLYERWFEFSCFLPVSRAHKSGPSAPFDYGPEVEATCKKYLQLRYRLLPYLYGLAHESAITGIPMLRPLVLEYQTDPASATAMYEYLLGPDLLVAPVAWENAVKREVYLPPGSWVSLEDGYEAAGGAAIGVSAPHDRLPLFVRAGAILPMAPDMLSTGAKPWDPVTLEIWPSGQSTAMLYQDDGATTAFARGESTSTTFRCAEVPGKSIAFRIEPENQKFGPRQWLVRFHLTSVPKSVELDGQNVAPTRPDEENSPAWAWDDGANVLTVRCPGERKPRTLEVALDGSSRPRPAAPKIDAPTPEKDVPAPATKVATPHEIDHQTN